jgi:hypothetical protein
MAAGIAGYDRKSLGEYIDNLALALVAPLGSYDDRGSTSSRFTSGQCKLQLE